MSRNYELLKQLEYQSDVGSQATAAAAAAAAQPRRSRPEIPKDVRRPDMPAHTQAEVEKLVFKLFAPPASKQMVVFAAVDANTPNVICAATANLLSANVRASVCVVDANFTHPRIAEYFRIENDKGLSDALAQTRSIFEVAHRAEDVDLTTITSGSALKGEHLMSDLINACVAELRSEFDFILIDAPPLSVSAAAMALGREADGVVLVIEADHDSREMTRNIQADLQQSNVNVLGAVLNNRKFPVPDRIYSWLR